VIADGIDRDRLKREADFHDHWAEETASDKRLVRECFEAPTAMENQFILDLMGPLCGKSLLDVGAGLGESAVYFAQRGAMVTLADISPGMVRTALELANRNGVTLRGAVCSAEALNVPENTYDYVYVANTIHHVQNRPALFQQIHRALKPGGKFFSIDPVEYNPAIQLYRRMATEVRTQDEKPLRYADIKLARQYFPDVRCRMFWISALLLFAKYYLVDRVHPNADRYWKRILSETPNTLRWWMPLQRFDALLTRIPMLRWSAWNVVMWGSKGVNAL
jgi:ubiquinone/menaquinone biosynthesis C-methylase UbiE